MNTTNAKITETFFGIEDHGILTFSLIIEYNGWSQGFGGYALDTGKTNSRERTSYPHTSEMLRSILETVGVNEWGKLNGKYIRIKFDGNRIVEIGHIIEDKWFNPKEFVNERRA